MKKIVISIFVVLIASSLLFSQSEWKQVRRTWYGSAQVMDIFFLKGTQYGWTVGLTYDTTTYQYKLARTMDGGLTWSPEVCPGLHSIFFIDSLKGWGVGGSGSGGVILNTVDGGETWNVQFYTNYIADCVYFVDENKGWVGCYYGGIYHTENGGQTWNLQYSLPDSSWIEEIFFTDSLTGYLVSDIPAGFPIARAYKTTNGGQNWFPLSISFGIVEAVFALHFFNADIGWIGTSYGIHSTTDGGTSWSYYSLPPVDYILAIDFVDSLYGWAVGGDFEIGEGDIYYTTDGGQTWVEAYSPLHNELWGVSASDRDNLWVTGWGGVIMYSSDGGITWEYQAGPGNNLHSIDAPDTLNIWAGGGYGTLIHSTDAGYNWEVLDPGINAWIYGVSFPTANQGWVVGGRNHVRHTSDCGITWQIQDPANYHWMTVDFVDTLNGWIAGYMTNYYVIYHTTDGGVTWFMQFQVPDLISINKIHFFDVNNGWAVGGDYGNLGYIFRTEDGGNSWDTITVTIPSSAKLYDVDFVSNTDGWAVSSDVILNTNDGGLTWETLNDTIMAYSVDFVDKNNGWVVGGGAFRTRDGGKTWSKDSGNVGIVGIVYIDVVAKDTLNAWVCAGRGRVWKYEITTSVQERDKKMAMTPLISLHMFPNPFFHELNVSYALPSFSEVSLKIYDCSGRLIKTLINQREQKPGIYGIKWNPDKTLPSGAYYFTLKTQNFSINKKIILLK